MKKIYALLFAILIAGTGFSQITLLSQDFNSYDGDSANFLTDYYVSWNSPVNGTPSASYYSSTGNFGLSANSYKFGIDSATIITPYFAGADLLRFWYKGNGTGTAPNKFMIYTSSDSITFTAFDSITTIPSTGTIYNQALDSNVHYLKFLYLKAVGNFAFDDLTVLNNQGVGIKKATNFNNFQAYPNPSANGIFTIDLENYIASADIVVFNIIGKQVYAKKLSPNGNNKHNIDLSALPSGSYFASVKAGSDKKMLRLVIN